MKKVTLLFATIALISSCGSPETKVETPVSDSLTVDTVMVADTVNVDTVGACCVKVDSSATK